MATLPWARARLRRAPLLHRILALTCEVLTVGALLLVAMLGWSLTAAGVATVRVGPVLARFSATRLPHLPTLPLLTVVAGGGVRG